MQGKQQLNKPINPQNKQHSNNNITKINTTDTITIQSNKPKQQSQNKTHKQTQTNNTKYSHANISTRTKSLNPSTLS